MGRGAERSWRVGRRGEVAAAAALLTVAVITAGCSPRQGPTPRGSTDRTSPLEQVTTPGPREIVESYLRAAAQGDGQKMYALLAASERKDHKAEDLTEDARENYPPNTTWEILKSEADGTVGSVVVELKGADVDPNPYRFTLSRENGAWRITQAPETEGGGADIEIKL